MKLSVGKLAKQTGVTVETIRHYTRKGLLRAERDSRNGYHRYPQSHVNRVNFIRLAKNLGFSLDDIAQILHDAEQGRSPCQRARHVIQSRIRENRRRLDEMIALQQRMENTLSLWDSLPDRLPDGDSICHLIEATGAEDANDT